MDEIYENLQLWHVERLKTYLRDRGLPHSGCAEKLRGMVLGAMVHI